MGCLFKVIFGLAILIKIHINFFQGGSEIWTAESQTVIASLAFHPVDRMLVIASYNELHFWDWSQPEPFAKCYTANEKEKVRLVLKKCSKLFWIKHCLKA